VSISDYDMSHVEPDAAVNESWAQGAVPKVAAAPKKSLIQSYDVDVLASGDASISAASSRASVNSPSVPESFVCRYNKLSFTLTFIDICLQQGCRVLIICGTLTLTASTA